MVFLLRNNPFHLVDASPWPILAGGLALILALSLVFWMHLKIVDYLFFTLVFLIFMVVMWWRDVVRESSYIGFHGFIVQKRLRIGILLFIVSEVFFFLRFFWAFFHSSLSVLADIREE